ncbi:hypothetical protein [Halomicrococcus sp. NG-SE-24]|uniref:hypothetical protein n=1 Tax=Halomicrococcus sp. NG-SE-24 TaxID=3436928 RepID=UPI003D996D3A
MINLVRDYDSTEGVDDETEDLVAEAANAGRQRFETVERSEQNTALVNFREQRAEYQQVEAKYLDVLEAGRKIADERKSMTERRTLQSKKAYRYNSASSSTLGADDGSYIRTL